MLATTNITVAGEMVLKVALISNANCFTFECQANGQHRAGLTTYWCAIIIGLACVRTYYGIRPHNLAIFHFMRRSKANENKMIQAKRNAIVRVDPLAYPVV